MTVLAPASFAELRHFLRHAVYQVQGPVALRYPRGGEGAYKADAGLAPAILRRGRDLTIVCYGTAVNEALGAAALLEKQGITATVLKLGQICPLQIEEILPAIDETGRVLVYEQCAGPGCVGERLLAALEERDFLLRGAKLWNLGGGLLPHGDTEALKRRFGMDAAGVAAAAMEMMKTDGKAKA